MDRQKRGFTYSRESGIESIPLRYIFLSFKLHEIIISLFQQKKHYLNHKSAIFKLYCIL